MLRINFTLMRSVFKLMYCLLFIILQFNCDREIPAVGTGNTSIYYKYIYQCNIYKAVIRGSAGEL